MQYGLKISMLYKKPYYTVRQEFEPKELYNSHEDIFKKILKGQAENSDPGLASIKLESRILTQ